MEAFLGIVVGLLPGAAVTITVTLASLAVALVLGFGLALARVFSRQLLVVLLIDAWCEIFRNVPALTHLFIIYFGLASVGLKLASIPSAIIGLGLIGAAVTAEIYRSGFSALPKGQTEAALAVGLTPQQTIRTILAPQALRIALPGLGNYALQLLKDTSIVSAIAAPEIMFLSRSMVTSSFQTVLIYLTAAALYLALSLPLALAFHRAERALSGGRA
jgi:polar amino acid transport system permease protein